MVVTSLDVTEKIEEVSLDYLNAKVMILELVTSLNLNKAETFVHPSGNVSPARASFAIRMIHVQLVY